MQLPEDFCREARQTLGTERYERFLGALREEAPTSIRLNPLKCYDLPRDVESRVPWCNTGYYLSSRPQFTFDPLLHAGLYYVQEASSMFVSHVLRTFVPREEGPVLALDLCAAPGGKSTAARTVLHPQSILVSNEPLRQRAQVLTENIIKFGHHDCIVTNNFPRDFRKTGLQFDVIIADVPCSGEGMFRKDEGAIAEWSPQHVAQCAQLQREIISDIWSCLKPGGLLVYSTCTLNLHENEENILWLLTQFDAELLTIPVESAWGITGSLHPDLPADGVCRFIPGFTRGEGLFMAALRKRGSGSGNAADFDAVERICRRQLQVLHAGTPETTLKGKAELPSHALAMSASLDRQRFPSAPLTWEEAVRYLRGESLTLHSSVPRGFVIVTYKDQPLGFVKNIGTRANNLYPDAWRIKSTHLPSETPKVLSV